MATNPKNIPPPFKLIQALSPLSEAVLETLCHDVLKKCNKKEKSVNAKYNLTERQAHKNTMVCPVHLIHWNWHCGTFGSSPK